MNYIERKVRSAPNLTQESALESLQSHPNFVPGTKIASLRHRSDRWVATLLIPKTSALPPMEEEESPAPFAPKGDKAPSDGPEGDSEGPDADGPEDGDSESDGPPKEEKKGPDEQILHVLTEILHALKGGPADAGIGGPDDLGPGLDGPAGPPPPPHGGPGGPPGGKQNFGPGGYGAKLKPGEVPNRPGVLPPGAPSFSSTQQSHPLFERIAKVAGRQRHIPISSPQGMTIKQAKADLDPIAQHFGYHVAQVRYCGPNCSCKTPGSSKIHALLEAN